MNRAERRKHQHQQRRNRKRVVSDEFALEDVAGLAEMSPEEREEGIAGLLEAGFLIRTERGYRLSMPEPTPEQRKRMILETPIALQEDEAKEYENDFATVTPEGRAMLDSGAIDDDMKRLIVEVVARSEGATMEHVIDLVLRLSVAHDGDVAAAADAVRNGRIGFAKAN
jgi:hypothetical protein